MIYIFLSYLRKRKSIFFEWLTLPKEKKTELHICLEAEQYEDVNRKKRIKKVVKAGPLGAEVIIDDIIRQLLTVTYLKPLRDANTELSAGNKSRISQVVQGLKEFTGDINSDKQEIVDKFQLAFEDLGKQFEIPVVKKIERATKEFFDSKSEKTARIGNKHMSFSEILKKLNLTFDEIGTGLGSSNLLFMALELILFEQEEIGLNLALVEEIEAHIHPQAQLRVIKFFEQESRKEYKDVQYIFTTHSPILAASLPLESIIMLHEDVAYSIGRGKTKLEADDYDFLERFLDATKSNLFFAKGVIMVEGDAENIFLPTFAEVIGLPLYKYGISIVNVGSLAFKRYSSIFLRTDEQPMNFPVSILSDLDFKEYVLKDGDVLTKFDEYLENKSDKPFLNFLDEQSVVELKEARLDEAGPEFIELFNRKKLQELNKRLMNKKTNLFDNNEKTSVYISELWTFEHTLLNSCLRDEMEYSILTANYKQSSNIENKKEEWEKIVGDVERATAAYQFMLDKNVSKSIVAQNLAKYVIDNQKALKSEILADPQLKYLVEMINHVSQLGGKSDEI
ncbi:ATP-dependent nuclease [Lactococcus garvieae]|uniref:ATP-dependent nuclease n=1 Tax=Lactococcus garvieae TaxID=1363 RepID=UPI001A920CB0|nr:TOPRIM nucleotidyl transferase/hydrolase domain-containing protein [Lactococcus garvieae]